MGKLGTLRPRLGDLQARIGSPQGSTRQERDRIRNAQPWRAWYSSPRWRALRERVFSRDGYKCQEATCGKRIGDPRERVCDHKQPHGGAPSLFWDITNLQTLCRHCHNSTKQRQERSGGTIKGDWS